ncbi:MAG TPA: hypothetical protein VE287_11005, partial [Actinopolymorphaceae bacterium]|nr:hypothetical protein [Actinopolymorphaceae bacterium]
MTGPIPGLSPTTGDEESTWTAPTSSASDAATAPPPDWRAPGTLAGIVAAEAMTMLSPTARAAEPGSDDDQRNRDESRRRSGFDDDYPDDLKPRRSRRSGPRRDPQ